MTILDLISMCKKRLDYLSHLRASAVHLGDINQVEKTDSDIAATQETLNQLLTL
jgi:hypothetical protein